MNLHEYQAKQLFAEYGLPVSQGFACDTPEEAAAAAEKIGGDMWVVKTQVHAGGRGKAGGVKLVDSPEAAAEFAANWLGKNLVTFQTDENGQPVSKILVEEIKLNCLESVFYPLLQEQKPRFQCSEMRYPPRVRWCCFWINGLRYYAAFRRDQDPNASEPS